MSFLQQPPAGPRGRSPDGSDLDGLLKRFFHAQMPDPWPDWQRSVQAPASGPKVRSAAGGRTLRAGRSVLAASVLLLLVGQLALTRLAPDAGYWRPTDGSDGPAEATRRQSGGAPALPSRPPSRSFNKNEASGKRPGR
jgi:hypothetical protein